MAVFLDRDWNTHVHLETCNPEDDARIKAGKEELEQQIFQFMVKERRTSLHMAAKERSWNPDHLPRQVQIEKGDSVPDYIHSFPGGANEMAHASLVSARLMELIESFKTAADRWAFFPIEVLHVDGSVYETRFAWCVERVFDAIDPASEGFKTVAGPVDGEHTWQVVGVRSPERQRVLKEMIGDTQAWLDFRCSPRFGVFVSDQLFDAMTTGGMTGFTAGFVCSEV